MSALGDIIVVVDHFQYTDISHTNHDVLPMYCTTPNALHTLHRSAQQIKDDDQSLSFAISIL